MRLKGSFIAGISIKFIQILFPILIQQHLASTLIELCTGRFNPAFSYKRLLELTKKAMPRDEIEKYEWEIGQFDKAAEPEGEFNQFKKEMKELVHSCPPGYKIGGRSSEQDGKVCNQCIA